MSFRASRCLRSLSIRDLKTNVLGQLISFSGTVTRTTEVREFCGGKVQLKAPHATRPALCAQVRPELIRATFVCGDCKTVHRNIEQQFKYTEPTSCANAACANRDRWELDRHNSVFVDWQRVRVQENAHEIPAGSMPRSAEVRSRAPTRLCACLVCVASRRERRDGSDAADSRAHAPCAQTRRLFCATRLLRRPSRETSVSSPAS